MSRQPTPGRPTLAVLPEDPEVRNMRLATSRSMRKVKQARDWPALILERLRIHSARGNGATAALLAEEIRCSVPHARETIRRLLAAGAITATKKGQRHEYSIAEGKA